MHMETLLEIVERAPLEDCRSVEILAANLYKKIAPYIEKGISTAEEELDFCSMIDVMLVEGGLTNQNAFAPDILNQIYDAAGFPHIYKG